MLLSQLISRRISMTLGVLCCAGFVANGTVVALARQAQLQSIKSDASATARDQARPDFSRETVENTERVTELQKEVRTMQDQKLTDRVTRLEAIAETNHTLLIMVASSIAVLLLETGLRLIALVLLKKKVG